MSSLPRITAEPNPAPGAGWPGRVRGTTRLVWECADTEALEVRVGSPDGPLFSRSGPQGEEATGDWVLDGTRFFLQDASPGAPSGPAGTLASVVVRVIVRRSAAAGVIFAYHRIATREHDRFGLSVTPQHFAEHLEVLRAIAQPISLADMRRAVASNCIKDRSVCVTFDDGYADNLWTAKPLLERAEVPATIFIVAGLIGISREFWWDELERALREPRSLPPDLKIEANGRTQVFRLTPEVTGQDVAGPGDMRSDPAEMDARLALHDEIHRLVKNLPDESAADVVQRVASWAGIEPAARPTRRVLSWDEVKLLDDSELIEIGAHTFNHPNLSHLPAWRQWIEIERSQAALGEHLGHTVASFAYPFGLYSEDTPSLVAAAGFECACTTRAAPVDAAATPFALPRLTVDDCDGDEFARLLAPWFSTEVAG